MEKIINLKNKERHGRVGREGRGNDVIIMSKIKEIKRI